jgi:outer membrane receptor protein involved in Fe transport
MGKLLCSASTGMAARVRMSSPVRVAVALSLIAASTVCAPALAQTQTPQSQAVEPLQEIVVTAEKRAGTVQDTAISMTALSGEQMSQFGITSVEQLMGVMPGISQKNAGPGQSEYEMRGLTSAGGSVATVGFYLDEIPLSASAVALTGRTVIDPDFFDMSHVEVLRGPQGTLYGAGSMGGTIKLITNPPKLGAFEGAAGASLSQTDGGRANGGGDLMLNFPFGETIAFRMSASFKYNSGWIDRIVNQPFPFPTDPAPHQTPLGLCSLYFCTRGDVLAAPVKQVIHDSNQQRLTTIRAALLFRPSDALNVTVNGMYFRNDADGYNQYQAPPGPIGSNGNSSSIYSNFQPYDIQEPFFDQLKLVGLTIHYDWTGAELTSATGYWKRYIIQSQDSTENLQNIFNLPYFLPTNFQEFDDVWQFSQELRLTSTGSGPWQWLVGGYYANLHSLYYSPQQSPAFATAENCVAGTNGPNCITVGNINSGGEAANPLGYIFVDHNPNEMQQEALFGETSYKLNEHLKATAGVRFFWFKVANQAHQCGVGTATGNASCQIGAASGSGNNILPKLNLSYQPNADLNLYATVSKGSRPGGVNLPIPLTPGAIYYCGPGSGPVFLTEQPAYYGPDSVWSYEAGVKSRFNDRRIFLNADAYYVRWENIQQVIALSCGYPYNTNAGTAKAYGPEVEFGAQLSSEWTLNLSGAYTKAYIYDPNQQAQLAGLSSGTAILNVPKYTGTAALDYAHPLSSGAQLVGRLTDSYTGPLTDIAYYRVELPSHNWVDLRFGYTKNTWGAFLVGNNITNQHSQLTIDNQIWAWQQPTVTRVSTNTPRTLGAEFHYKF